MRTVARWTPRVLLLQLQLLAGALQPSQYTRCVAAQNTSAAATYLNSVEQDVMRLAAQATQNFINTCDLVTTCGGNCTWHACHALQKDLAINSCTAVPDNTDCNNQNGTAGCPMLPVNFNRSSIRCRSSHMWRPHTFQNAGFETEFGGPRQKNFGLEMCLILRSLVSRLIQNATLISEANRTICAQRMLDPTFEDISNATYALTDNNFHVTAWSYFGSVEGIQRSFPGRDTQDSQDTKCNFDPRLRPWYMGATAVQKDIVVLLDAGYSMGNTVPGSITSDTTKFMGAINIIKALLDTLTFGDRVTVVQFTSSNVATVVYQTVTVNSNASSTLQPLKDALDASSVESNSANANLRAALVTANQSFAPNTNAFKVILGFTDGQYADSSLLQNVQPILGSLKNQSVMVFLYSFDTSNSTNDVLTQVACYVNGSYERIERTVWNPLWTLRSYFGIVTRLRLVATGFKPFWTKTFKASNALGQVITAAYPAFAPDNFTLIGVAGVQVPVELVGSIAVDAFSTELAKPGRVSADPTGITVTPFQLPCKFQLSGLNKCSNDGVSIINPICVSDENALPFGERVCSCKPECQAIPNGPSGTSMSRVMIIAGASVGSIVGIAVFVTIAILCYCRCQSRRDPSLKESMDPTSPLKSEGVLRNVSPATEGVSVSDPFSDKPSISENFDLSSMSSHRPRSAPSNSAEKSTPTTPRLGKSDTAAAWPQMNQTLSRDLVAFSNKQLEAATNGWAQECLLGNGAHGNVYKGNVEGLCPLAIKRPHPGIQVAKCTFDQELDLLSKLNHRCLLRIIGYCEGDRILVFEFMENGTLEDCLHKNRLERQLTWEERLKIAMGAAKGLEYLHEYATTKIIHGDVKPSNILLNERLEARISDFGLSLWTTNTDTSQLWASCMGGTPGYFDPEFTSLCAFTFGSDVYSFGVVLLELLSGRKVVQDAQNIVRWAIRLYKRHEIHLILDRRLPPPNDDLQHQLKNIVKLALQCTQSESKDRPNMKEVAALLSQVLSASQKWHDLKFSPHVSLICDEQSRSLYTK